MIQERQSNRVALFTPAHLYNSESELVKGIMEAAHEHALPLYLLNRGESLALVGRESWAGLIIINGATLPLPPLPKLPVVETAPLLKEEKSPYEAGRRAIETLQKIIGHKPLFKEQPLQERRSLRTPLEGELESLGELCADSYKVKELMKTLIERLSSLEAAPLYLTLFEKEGGSAACNDSLPPGVILMASSEKSESSHLRVGTIYEIGTLLMGAYPEGGAALYPLISGTNIYGYLISPLEAESLPFYSALSGLISTRLRALEELGELQENFLRRLTELHKSNLRLSGLDSYKNSFIARIIHDLRSPLMVTMNLADILLKFEQSEEEKRKHYLSIYKSSIRLKGISDRLLELTRLEAKEIELSITPLRLFPFLKNLIDYYHTVTMKMGITLQLLLPEEEPDNFYCDRVKLEKMLNHLISNALKFTKKDEGEVTISLETEPLFVRLTVTDNGRGLDSEELKDIFNNFTPPIEPKRQATLKHTGMGLTYCREMCRFLSGELHAHSEGRDRGCSFILTLRRGREHFRESDFSKEEREISSGEQVGRLIEWDFEEREKLSGCFPMLNDYDRNELNFDIKKALILVVDDNSSIRSVIYNYLSLRGYQNIILATDGRLGLDAVYHYSPDLIISDYKMPNMSGEEFHDALSSQLRFSHIPFIFLSAIADRDIIIRRKEMGAYDFLSKPIEEKEFLVTVEANLKKYMNYKRTHIRAVKDDLTGVYNRREFLRLFTKELERRDLDNLSLIFFDVDHFKHFNDSYGHQAGDEVLREIGKALNRQLKGEAIGARLGGEEFAVLLSNCSMAVGERFCNELRQAIKGLVIEYKELSLTVTSSFGLVNLKTSCPERAEKLGELKALDGEEELLAFTETVIKELLELADRAMYIAKKSSCRSCGFSSQRAALFTDGLCHRCGSDNLDMGRDRIGLA